jgi:phosphopantothenoylcysteine decarboxylase/phosphopantothenate--cysteine ligase
MKVIVTAGPTREYLDPVRFITNASSGTMGFAVARAAAARGHRVTLLCGPVEPPADLECDIARFVSVSDLREALAGRFSDCDALVMTAAVGDFRPERYSDRKISRSGGPVTIRLVPTEDVLAGVAAGKRANQAVVAFAVEDGPEGEIETKARSELAQKHADMVVVNTPAAMAAADSRACILSADSTLLPWAVRPKGELATAIVLALETLGPRGGGNAR